MVLFSMKYSLENWSLAEENFDPFDEYEDYYQQRGTFGNLRLSPDVALALRQVSCKMLTGFKSLLMQNYYLQIQVGDCYQAVD